MTKRELIEAVADARQNLPRRDVESLVNSVFKTLSEALTRGERIEIRGFGSFVVKQRNAREGLNPKTGATVRVAAKRVPFFKAGKELKLRVDGKPGGGRAEMDRAASVSQAQSAVTGAPSAVAGAPPAATREHPSAVSRSGEEG